LKKPSRLSGRLFIWHLTTQWAITACLAVEARDRLVEAARGEDVSYFSLTGQIRAAFQDRCGYHLDVFGTRGKA